MLRIALLAVALVLLAPAAGAQNGTGVAANAASQTAASQTAVPRGFVRLSLPVATRALSRGDTVRAHDFALVDTTLLWRWATLPDTTREITGWVARRPIATGELL